MIDVEQVTAVSTVALVLLVLIALTAVVLFGRAPAARFEILIGQPDELVEEGCADGAHDIAESRAFGRSAGVWQSCRRGCGWSSWRKG